MSDEPQSRLRAIKPSAQRKTLCHCASRKGGDATVHEMASTASKAIVIVTCANEAQAEAAREELDARGDRLGDGIRAIAVADPEGRRVGSGGGTLNALVAADALLGDGADAAWLDDTLVVVVHSGGDSQRSPSQSVCGKAWSLLPRATPATYRAVQFVVAATSRPRDGYARNDAGRAVRSLARPAAEVVPAGPAGAGRRVQRRAPAPARRRRARSAGRRAGRDGPRHRRGRRDVRPPRAELEETKPASADSCGLGLRGRFG